LRGTRGVRHAVPDTQDAEDKLFVRRPGPVPDEVPLAPYLELGLPVMDQGNEHACTGFGLAAVVHYLRRDLSPPPPEREVVSPRMLYEIAKRYDRLEGEEGSTARGALKGWHKHGVCTWQLWPYVPDRVDRELTEQRRKDAALRRPLAYERVDELDVDLVRAAIAQIGIVYVTAEVHDGWRHVGTDGRIEFSSRETGTHAFALVAYDAEGFWLHNSKGPKWGRNGFGHLSAVDWARSGVDAWVAYLEKPAGPD
jgi:hypothetical protein